MLRYRIHTPVHEYDSTQKRAYMSPPGLIMQILFCMAFLLNIFLVSSGLKNTLARVATGKRYTDSSLSILKELHWLLIDARIKIKIATLTFKALNTGNPPYLATPCRTLRSASANLFLSRDVTGHLVLVVSVQLLLPSGIVSQLTSVLLQLSQHSVGI